MTTVETDATIDDTEVASIDAYWRAANYLSVGQIYLLDNPLLREPLRPEHVKPRLLGHWGTTPGLNFVYAHMNRVIRARDLDTIYVDRPGPRRPGPRRQHLPRGHLQRGLPATSAATRRACGGCSGSSRSRAASRATSRPRRPARSTRAASSATRSRTPTAPRSTTPTCSSCCVVGDGEAETGPLAASWHSNKFLDPARDGAVLPILHLNGYKIANPTVLARIPHDELRALLEGYGYEPLLRRGRRPGRDAPARWRRRSTRALDEIAEIQAAARSGGGDRRGRAGR